MMENTSSNFVTLVFVKKLHQDAIIPVRQTELSSGLDLYAVDVASCEYPNMPYDDTFTFYELEPGERVLVKTGLALQMPEGMEAQIRPRSGMALKRGVTVGNSPGTIDRDFTSDIGVILVNHGDEVYLIRKGDRIAQLVFQNVLHDVELVEAETLDKTGRGEGAFGSTGQA
ncbi:deoxyuridine 5'-triphosphate nucleotidohydrolase Dut [Desulfofarcimen acetoxidans DSM 771]|uniref:dUTP diphosphatase n=2 Tax=Desulfofarcimen acetoxidans TaxID=58138 RepID=C8VXR9_DESAS|nr:deoxyuridine 5'-triphosphate nucleotidohydrolase Dut [Desulfofarcimen acetoxidans DSM 771]